MAKIKLDLNNPLQDFSDDKDAVEGMKPLSGKKETLARLLATLLKASPEGDALDHLDWALELHRNGVIEVDDSDFKYIREFVQNSKNTIALFKGQLLRALDAAKEAAKTKQ